VRVLYVSDVYFPRVNGVSTSIRTFRSDLAACGVESCLIAPDYAAEKSLPEENIVRVAGARIPRDPEDRRMRYGALRDALARLRNESFDLVHIHTPFVAHYAGLRFARKLAIPCIATYHTFFEEYLHHYVPAMPRTAGRWLARAFTRSQCRQLDALIAPSEAMRRTLIDYGVATPVHVVPTGLPAGRFKRGDGARFRRDIGIAPATPLVLYVGRVAFEKNIDFLVRSFKTALSLEPSALLLIAGEGPAQASIRALAVQLGIAASVRFVGYLERDSVLLDCYAAADIFVFASRTETQGLVLLEAMAQGTPVVSIAALGTTSILAGERGAVVVPEDKDAFAQAVVSLLHDPRRRARLSLEGREYAQTWSSLRMAQRLAAVYAEVNHGHATTAAQQI